MKNVQTKFLILFSLACLFPLACNSDSDSNNKTTTADAAPNPDAPIVKPTDNELKVGDACSFKKDSKKCPILTSYCYSDTPDEPCDEGVCIAMRKAGESCHSGPVNSEACDINSYCKVSEGICIAFPKVGESCENAPCKGGYCDFGEPSKCVALKGEGAECSPTASNCDNAFYCSEGKCTKKTKIGDHCTSRVECTEYTCTDNKCAKWEEKSVCD